MDRIPRTLWIESITTRTIKFHLFYSKCIHYSGKHIGTTETSSEIRQISESIRKECTEASHEKTQHKTMSPSSSGKSSTEQITERSSYLSSTTSELQSVSINISSSQFTNHSVKSPTTRIPPLYRRNSTGPGMIFPAIDPLLYPTCITYSKSSPFSNPHFDKRFFDSSLVERRGQASSLSTLDYNSSDEIWIRRADFEQERLKKVLFYFK